MTYQEQIREEFNSSKGVLEGFMINENFQKIEEAADTIVHSIQQGGKVISCGNGGSMCDAMHFAEELTGRYRENREALPAVAISDSGYLSCVGNDFGYGKTFSRFVAALGQSKDILLAISSSGNSKNVLEACQEAARKGMKVISLTGKGGGALKNLPGINIDVEYHGYADRIQEIHIKIIHVLILLIEQKMNFCLK